MNIKRTCKLLLLLSCSMIFVTPAKAVLLDFDSATTGSFLTGTYVEDGFRVMSVSGHYDFFGFGGSGGTNYLNIDTVADGTFGPISSIRIDFFSALFSLNSLDVIDATFGSAGLDGILTSSNGGSVALSSIGAKSFSGAAWTNISWLEYSVGPDNGGASLWGGIDSINVTAAVPEPAALGLIGLGLLALGFIRRQHQ